MDAIKDAKGNVTQRADFSKSQVKQVAAFEKSYTKAENKLASHPDRPVTISVPGGGKDQTVTAGFIARTLADRTVIASPSEKGGGSTVLNETTIYSGGLSGVGTFTGVHPSSADQGRQLAITHEGMHGTNADETRGNMPYKEWNDAHQVPFNQAAEDLLRD